MSNYSYKALDLVKIEIRVLEILTPGSTTIDTDPVQFSIRYVSLDELRPEFARFVATEAEPFFLPVARI